MCLLQQLFILHISIIFKLRFIVTVEIYLRSLFTFYQKSIPGVCHQRVDLFPLSVGKSYLNSGNGDTPGNDLQQLVTPISSWKSSQGKSLLKGSYYPCYEMTPWWETGPRGLYNSGAVT